MYGDPQKRQKHIPHLLHTTDNSPVQLNESWAGRRLVEALRHLPPNNFSASLDMKFQKKQMLEREQKRMALAGGEFPQASKNDLGNGKVRQMFDDRRRGVGIDRSHPLQPIMASSTSTSRTKPQYVATNNHLIRATNTGRRPALSTTAPLQNTTTIRSSIKNNYSISNGNLNVFDKNLDKVDNIDNESFPREFSLLSLSSTHVMGPHVADDPDFDSNNNEEGNNILDAPNAINKNVTTKTNNIKLNPVVTKKSPTTAVAAKTTSSGRPSLPANIATNSVRTPPAPKGNLSSTTNKAIKSTGNKAKPATFILSVKPPPRITTPPPGMASCKHCQRHFDEERLEKHEEVCKKMMSKKRKIFDASKHRVKGTDAEKYLRKGKNVFSTAPKSITISMNTPHAAKISSEKKSNWRKKHEEFIAAIREAKKVKAYLAKGGKLSDLPPPPPSENPDYIQCPHCNRRFNESAAERHIPKCANMLHNKSKSIKKRC